MKSLGIEITPDTIRAALFDSTTQVLEQEKEYPFPPHLSGLPEAQVEVDPAAIVQTVLASINDLGGSVESDIEVWMTGRAGGVVLTDELGRAKSNFVSWKDRRASQIAVMNKSHLERLADQWVDPKFGTLRRELHASSMFAILYTLADAEALPDGVLPLTLPDFVVSHLCRQPGRMHYSLGIGMLDFQTNDWSYKALERAGLGDLWLPEITLNLSHIGQVKSGKRNIYFRPPVSELQASLLGNRLTAKEIGLHFDHSPRITTIQYGNGALSKLSVPYFEQQRLLSVPLSDAVSPVDADNESLSEKKCRDLALQCQAAAKSFIDLERFDSILVSGASSYCCEQVATALTAQFNKNVRFSLPNAGLIGLLKLAQS